MKVALFCIVGGSALFAYSVLGAFGGIGAGLLALGYVILRGAYLSPQLEYERKRNEIGLLALQDQLEVARKRDQISLEMMKDQGTKALEILTSQRVAIDASTQLTYQQTEVMEKQADLLNQAKNRMRGMDEEL